jgi:hypothetical protein
MDTSMSGLEKSGSILLTEEDILLAHQGIVSDRVKQTWGLTLVELQQVVNNNDYTKITN